MFRKLIAVWAIVLGCMTSVESSALAQGDAPAAAAPTEEAAPAAAAAPAEAAPAAAAAPAEGAAEAAPAEGAAEGAEAAPAEGAAEAAPAEGEAPAEGTAPAEAAAAAAADDEGEAAAAEGTTAGEEEVVEEADPYPFTDVEPDTYWMPDKASDGTDHVDWMFYAILGLSVFCFVAITIAVVYLTWRYRHREGHHSEPSRAHDNVLEVTWTVIPSIICVFIFIGGWKGYLSMSSAPGDALEINVVGQKWVWNFSYNKDLETVQRSELHVPVDTPVKLIMRSEDVLHSFYMPAMRVKQDVIPNRYTYLWFEANKPGVYRVYCAEYCGDAHSDMKTKVIVHEPGGYEAWLNEEYEKDQVDCREFDGAERDECYQTQGERIYEGKGCKQCHSLDGSAGTGPTFQGMWGQSRSFTDGSSGTVDENYIRESVFDPMAKIRSGFAPVMPTFKGKLKDKDIDALANWMKSL